MRTRSNLSSSEFKVEEIKREKSGRAGKRDAKSSEKDSEKQSESTDKKMSPEHESETDIIHGNDVNNNGVQLEDDKKEDSVFYDSETDKTDKTRKSKNSVAGTKELDLKEREERQFEKSDKTKAQCEEESVHSSEVEETLPDKNQSRTGSRNDDKNTANTSVSKKSTKQEEIFDKKLPSGFQFPGAIPPFPPNPSNLLSGNLQSEFAKSLSAQFYNSLSLLASQAMMNVKQEPKDGSFREIGTSESPSTTSTYYKTTTNNSNSLKVPPRTDSRSSDGSAHSYDGRYRAKPTDFSRRSRSPAPSGGGSEIVLQRPPSGLSPKSLAEQLKNNDSASMVVSRQQKYTSRNSGFNRQPPFPTSARDNSTPPSNVFPTLNLSNEPHSSIGGVLPVPPSNSMSSSPSLHHFTTRYTIETPADPSRLGVELVLDHDNDEPVIEVECGGNRGLLYVNKLCQGSKGQSIHFGDEWLTPNEFQFISGRETAKDWKRSIRHCGKSLKTLMTKGILQVHPPVCDCNQCRGLHAGSKLLAVPVKNSTQLSQKDVNNNISTNSQRIKTTSPFGATTDSDPPHTDDMTRHGFAGDLNSIISQLRKANGFDAPEPQETLDLSTKSHNNNNKNGNISPNYSSRKRSRNDMSPEPRSQNDESVNNGRASSPPSTKRPYSRQEDYSQRRYDQSSFAASYPFLSPEEQYRRMLALLNRSISPSEQQRHIFNMAQSMADPLSLSSNTFGGFQALANSLKLDGRHSDRSKSRYKTERERKNEEGNPYDLSRKSGKKSFDSPNKRCGYSPDRYRKTDRRTPTSSSHRTGDQKYIALESRQRDNRFSNHRDDERSSWPAHKHSTMIELNSSGSSSARIPDWIPRSNDRNSSYSTGKEKSPRKNIPFNGFFQDNNIVLDRVPISKTPVTTLHHRPPSNYSAESDARRHPGSRQKSYQPERDYHRRSSGSETSGSKLTPMLDLQKHAVPMLSLKRPTLDDLFSSESDRNLGKRLSNTSDQEMKEINENEASSIRQSSSAPPPNFSPHNQERHSRRPTSAQDHRNSDFLHPIRKQTTSPVTSRSLIPHKNSDEVINFANDFYMKRRDDEIQSAVDEMRQWSTHDVCEFIRNIDDSVEEHIEEFRKHEIDGEGLPLLTEQHLMDIMNIKLGRALKVIARIRRKLKVPQLNACCHHTLLCPNFSSTSKVARDNLTSDHTDDLIVSEIVTTDNGIEMESGIDKSKKDIKIEDNNSAENEKQKI